MSPLHDLLSHSVDSNTAIDILILLPDIVLDRNRCILLILLLLAAGLDALDDEVGVSL